MNILGIDPGKKGAICLLSSNGEIMQLTDIPLLGKEVDAAGVFEIIGFAKQRSDSIFCYIEKQHIMPGQAGQFTIGVNYGFLIMALNAHGISYEEISPRKWQKSMGIVKADKKESVRLADQFFKGWEFTTKRGRILDGRAEAALIAMHGYKSRFN